MHKNCTASNFRESSVPVLLWKSNNSSGRSTLYDAGCPQPGSSSVYGVAMLLTRTLCPLPRGNPIWYHVLALLRTLLHLIFSMCTTLHGEFAQFVHIWPQRHILKWILLTYWLTGQPSITWIKYMCVIICIRWKLFKTRSIMLPQQQCQI